MNMSKEELISQARFDGDELSCLLADELENMINASQTNHLSICRILNQMSDAEAAMKGFISQLEELAADMEDSDD